MHVFVLLFNARTDNEGIHTLNLGDRNIVLMFESEDDATRYALMLEAQDFATPVVEGIDSEEVEEFCQGVGYEYQLVPAGFVPETDAERLLLVPPEANLEQTDWSPDGETAAKPPSRPATEEEPTEFSDSDLEQIRRRLEGLL